MVPENNDVAVAVKVVSVTFVRRVIYSPSSFVRETILATLLPSLGVVVS